MLRRLLLGLICLATWSAAAKADPLMFTTEVQADFELSLLGGTPLNPGPTTPFLPFRAIGNLTFQLDPLLNSPSQPTTVPFVDVTGVLQGTPPSLPVTLPFTISPNLQFLGGSLTNIVRDASGHVVSADVTDLEMRWDLVSTSPFFPVTIYSKDGLRFDATGVSIPFALGDVLSGPSANTGYLALGGDPANDPAVIIVEDRTLTVVPEPTSAILLGAGAVSIFLATRLRRWTRRSEVLS
jgi:hypothetical protein